MNQRKNEGWHGHGVKTSTRRALLVSAGIWTVVTLVGLLLHDGQGLRGQYFGDPSFARAPAFATIDREISTAQLFRRWKAAPPESFSVQWSGYLSVNRSGRYGFATASDHESRLYIDKRLVVSNIADGDVGTQSGDVELSAGSHAIVLQYVHDGGRYLMEWSWTPPGGGAAASVPDRVLSIDPVGRASLIQAIDWVWWIVTAAWVVAGTLVALSYWTRRRRPAGRWLAVRAALLLALSWFYVAAATEHAQTVNTFKARGDQSAYLWDAQQVYANANGRQPPMLIGARARMPIYAGFLSLFYTPRLTDEEFFDVAKTWNIRLSILLLGALAIVFGWQLPPVISLNLTLVVAFSYFVFKAGYSQPELLFYFFFFLTFLGCWHLLRRPSATVSVVIGISAGIFAGLAYLTKALVPPFVAIFASVYLVEQVVLLIRQLRRGDALVTAVAFVRFRWNAFAGVAFVASFLLVIAPYILNNKRFFGSYFFNLNTTYYVWYDNGAAGRIIVDPDDQGYTKTPSDQLQSVQTYLSSHTTGAIVERLADGFKDTAIRSYEGYGYLKYLLLYAGIALLLAATNWRAFVDLVRSRTALVVFLILYAAVYLPATAFFVVTSSTGAMRFLLAHAAPLFFALSRFFALEPFGRTEWSIRGLRLTAAHLNVLVLIVIGIDLTMFLWPRVMTTYGGF